MARIDVRQRGEQERKDRIRQGQGAPQVVALPSGQIKGGPAAQSTMSHPCVPARPGGQRTTQWAPAAQVEWQGDVKQVNVHALCGPHVHWPLAHVPLQVEPVSHVTWHGGAAHVNAQLLPRPQVQVPFAQTPLQLGLSPSQVAWQGGAAHVRSQLSPAGQSQTPLSQDPEPRQLCTAQIRTTIAHPIAADTTADPLRMAPT